jgi:DNA-binding NtrC family response regulator
VARTLTNRSDRKGKAADDAPVAHLACVLDAEQPQVPGSLHSLATIDEVLLGRGDKKDVRRKGRTLTIAHADPRMSERHARLVRGDTGWIVEDLGSRNGTFVEGERVTKQALDLPCWLELGRTAFRMLLQPPADHVDADVRQCMSAIGELATFSTPFSRTLADLARIAFTKQSVLVHGETGTGKELIARGLHTASRRNGAFIAVNCGALPATLVESELFGYRKGAFSGALEDRPGLVRAADGGTLFLDEIADLPLGTQAALLRVLQEREIMPLGAARAVSVDVRIVAATHHDLERAVSEGKFREDLLARLAGHVVEVPALRERREDLGILIGALLARASEQPLRLAPEAASALLRYAWPRNVRELEQAIASAAALARDGVIEPEHLPPALRGGGPATEDELSPAERRRRDELRALLAKHHGNLAAVGRALGVARMQIHRWIERYNIDLDAYRRDR